MRAKQATRRNDEIAWCVYAARQTSNAASRTGTLEKVQVRFISLLVFQCHGLRARLLARLRLYLHIYYANLVLSTHNPFTIVMILKPTTTAIVVIQQRNRLQNSFQ